MASRWYVVQTKSSQEQFAGQELKNQKFKVFCPCYQKSVKRGSVTRVMLLPLFPGYIFVKFDVAKARWRSVNGTRGVIGLLGMRADAESVSPLPKGFVEELSKGADKHGVLGLEASTKRLIKYAVGDEVRINDSSFKGLVGKVCESSADRVTLFLSLLNNKIKLSLPVEAVEPA